MAETQASLGHKEGLMGAHSGEIQGAHNGEILGITISGIAGSRSLETHFGELSQLCFIMCGPCSQADSCHQHSQPQGRRVT